MNPVETDPEIREWRCAHCNLLMYRTRGSRLIYDPNREIQRAPFDCHVGHARYVYCSRRCLFDGLERIRDEDLAKHAYEDETECFQCRYPAQATQASNGHGLLVLRVGNLRFVACSRRCLHISIADHSDDNLRSGWPIW